MKVIVYQIGGSTDEECFNFILNVINLKQFGDIECLKLQKFGDILLNHNYYLSISCFNCNRDLCDILSGDNIIDYRGEYTIRHEHCQECEWKK